MNEIVYGIHTVKSVLKFNPNSIISVYVCSLKQKKNNKLYILINKLKNLGKIINLVSKKYLDKKTKNSVHQNIVIYVKSKKILNEKILFNILKNKKTLLFLVLDNITDPHNLGACIRCADAAGVSAVIIPCNKSAPLNSTVKKVACGAVENVPIISVTNLLQTLRFLQKNNIWIIGTTEKANKNLYESKLNKSIAIVFGSENLGIRKTIKNCCNELIKIPMTGSISSLNVSVSVGICLFESIRQRKW